MWITSAKRLTLRLGPWLLAGAVRSGALALAFLLLAATAPPSASAADSEDDRPIVLTNEDVTRLKEAPNPQDKRGSGLIIISKPRDESARARKSVSKSQQDPADSWQEEYYRLKALALKRAIDSGAPINFGDRSAPEEPQAPPAALAIRPANSKPSCLYGGDGALIHAPEGVECPQDRRERPLAAAAPARTSERGSRDTCLYGRSGKALHTPRGSRCDRGSAADQ